MTFTELKYSLSKCKDTALADSIWHEYLAYQTPMGSLISNNSLLQSLETGELNLIHFTSSYDEILKSGVLKPSGGGLGACIYTVQAFQNNNIHNLGSFLYNIEIPNFKLAKNIKSKTRAILIKILGLRKYPSYLNYLTFGDKYLKAYINLYNKGLIHEEEKLNLDKLVLDRYRIVLNFAYQLQFKNLENISDNNYIDLLNRFVHEFPEMRNLYFETIIEYLFLFQNDDNAIKSMEKGELNNVGVKTAIFNLCPSLYKKFSTKMFDPTIENIIIYLEGLSQDGNLIKNFDSSFFLEFIKYRFSKHLIVDLLENLNINTLADKDSLTIENLYSISPNFVGNLYYKNSKHTDEIEQEFATIFQDFTSFNPSPIMTYRDTPKGEIGINTSMISIENCQFYNADVLENGVVRVYEKINLIFENNLVHKSKRVMRDPS